MECFRLEVVTSLGKDPPTAFLRELRYAFVKAYLPKMATAIVDLAKRFGDYPGCAGFGTWQGMLRTDGRLFVACRENVLIRHVALPCSVMLDNGKDGGVETI